MNNIFCSDQSRQAGEDLIGTATGYQTYILIECPQPWVSEAFNSKWVPENLRLLVEETYSARLPIKFLLISNNLSHKKDQTTLLIYHKEDGLAYGYRKQEFQLPNIQQAAKVIKQWLWNKKSEYAVESNISRDILICAHGSHDQCCARYGNPFYFHAVDTIEELGLNNIRLWKSTHFGGHRFAPTAIDLPSARYYGKLDLDLFKSILTRQGNIKSIYEIYRGWGALPRSIQVLERELILRYGWDWFNYKVAGRIIDQSSDEQKIFAEIAIETTDGSLLTYHAKLIRDDSKIVEVKGSCHDTTKTKCLKYSVESLRLVSNQKEIPLSA